MQQTFLDDEVLVYSGRNTVPVVGVVGSAATLTKSQKRFNNLIERLTRQRQELARWQAFRQTYHQQLADNYHPVAAHLRDKRIAMVRLLDRAMDGKALKIRERAKVRDIIGHLLSQLLAEAQDADLVRFYDKYADRSFADEQQEHGDFMRTLASEAFAIDMVAYPGGASPEELAAWFDEQVQATGPEPRRSAGRKKNTKTIAREAQRDQAVEGGTRAVREVFRKLVSELHPDRETDPAEHARKTELMQRVNQAYKAGDLLALLELQLSIEQINSAALAGLADERLRHYIHVLEEQSRRLRDELSEFIAPFAMAVGDCPLSKLTPAIVQRALDADIREIAGMARALEADLIRFQDVQQLKSSLHYYLIDPLDGEEWATAPEQCQPRSRRRRNR
jgi:hypothetical protein